MKWLPLILIWCCLLVFAVIADASTYTISVTASNGQGTSLTGTDTVTVSSAPVGFYVSTTGSDSNDGLAATAGGGHGPFATLGKAQSAMQNSSTIKTAYLEAGTWNSEFDSYPHFG